MRLSARCGSGSQPSTPQGEAALIASLRENRGGLAVMEASGGYERRRAEPLRKAGIAVRVFDPKRVRYFAKSAGRPAKNDPIDAEMIAWFGETFRPEAEPTHEPERLAARGCAGAPGSWRAAQSPMSSSASRIQPASATIARPAR